MNFPEENPRSEEPASPEQAPAGEVIFPEESDLPEGFTPLGSPAAPAAHLPRARRRRAHRMLVPPGADERAAVLSSLARRAFPSFEFFVFTLLCGAVLGAAYLLDSPALLLLGILLAPLLNPWVGLTLAIMTGSWRFFFLTLGGMLVASLLVFFTGALAGLAGHLWLPLRLFHANIHAHLWWPDLFLVALGAILITISFVRSEQKPILPSIMLAYGLFLPLSAGGVGLGIGAAPIYPDGVKVFLVHLALATLVGCISLAALRFKPAKAGGFLLPVLISLLALAGVVYYTGLTTAVRDGVLATRRIDPTPTILVAPSNTPTIPATATPTATWTATGTPLPSETALPTSAYAVITAISGGGALVRSEAGGGTVVAVLSNGITIQVLPERQTVDAADWVHIRWDAIDGWVLSTVLTATTSTPPPPAPSATPTR